MIINNIISIHRYTKLYIESTVQIHKVTIVIHHLFFFFGYKNGGPRWATTPGPGAKEVWPLPKRCFSQAGVRTSDLLLPGESLQRPPHLQPSLLPLDQTHWVDPSSLSYNENEV